MALNDTQLDDIKTKLEAGTTLREIVNNDYSSEKIREVRQQMVTKYGQSDVQGMMMDSRMVGKTVEELNTVITGIQGRLTRVTAIRDSKL